MGYKVGTDLTLDNALKMMIVRSANDIAVALAETIGGSGGGFVERMNAVAQRLGMTGPSSSIRTACRTPGKYDGARPRRARPRLLARLPRVPRTLRHHAIRPARGCCGARTTPSSTIAGANGMKTGFVCASGFNVVATATANGRTLIAVVIGDTSAAARAETAAGLLNRGFNGGLGGLMGQNLAKFPLPAVARAAGKSP